MIHNYSKGLIDRNAKRARNLSLADLVAWYDLHGKPKNKKKTNVVDVNNLPLETGDHDNDDDEEIKNDLPEKNAIQFNSILLALFQ